MHSLLEGSPSERRFILNFRLYVSFNIKTTLGLKPFATKTCQTVCTRAPTGITSTTLRTFVTGWTEGDRSTKEAFFTDFIWTFSVLVLTPFCCDCLVKAQKLQESQQTLHLSEHELLRQIKNPENKRNTLTHVYMSNNCWCWSGVRSRHAMQSSVLNTQKLFWTPCHGNEHILYECKSSPIFVHTLLSSVQMKSRMISVRMISVQYDDTQIHITKHLN